MIEALYQIGKILPGDGLLAQWVDEIDCKRYLHVLKIMFNYDKIENIHYAGIELEKNSPERKMKYLYKQSKGNIVNPTPTTLVTELKKTLCNKKRFFQSFIKIHKNQFSETSIKFHHSLQKCVEENEDLIFQEILEVCKTDGLIQAKGDDWVFREGGVISLGFCRNGEREYVGDISHFTDYLLDAESIYRSYYKCYNVESRSSDKFCYVCRKQVPEVWGFVNTFNFYTVDKPGMVTGGFDQKRAWRNYPVCPQCSATLLKARKYIDAHLSRRFCGFNYYIVPQLIAPDDELLTSVLNDIIESIPSFSTSGKEAMLIQQSEEEVLEVLARESNAVNFHFVFYETHQSEFKILLYLQDIAPSRLARLLNVKSLVDKTHYAGNVFGQFEEKFNSADSPPQFKFSFGLLRNFFPNSRFEGDFNALFLELVNNIFIGKKIDATVFFQRFMQRIRQAFLNGSGIGYQICTVQAYKILLYVYEIDQLIFIQGGKMESAVPFDEFFASQKLLDDSAQRAVFLLGVLAQKLLRIQYQQSRSAPFRARLNGLKIDARVVRRLLPELINKLEEYKKNYYHELESAISRYLLHARLERFSVTELSFYFTLGMSLSGEFKFAKETHDINENSHPSVPEQLSLEVLND